MTLNMFIVATEAYNCFVLFLIALLINYDHVLIDRSFALTNRLLARLTAVRTEAIRLVTQLRHAV